MPLAHRYALYLAPTGPWREHGSRWLGRCADTGEALSPLPGQAGYPREWTQAPRHYGLHATLKPPFRLCPGASPQEVDAAARRLAGNRAPFTLALECEPLRGFLAWRIAGADQPGQARIQALADAAVRDLDPLRAPPTPEDIARRQPQSLTPAQQAMLARWGYPYVFDTYTFHITLTGKLEGDALAQAQAGIATFADPLRGQAMDVPGISVYVQAAPGADFVAARHYHFDGTCSDAAGAAYLQGPAAA
ncbi:putative phosphonate metabolism protein [compost metagenome]